MLGYTCSKTIGGWNPTVMSFGVSAGHPRNPSYIGEGCDPISMRIKPADCFMQWLCQEGKTVRQCC